VSLSGSGVLEIGVEPCDTPTGFVKVAVTVGAGSTFSLEKLSLIMSSASFCRFDLLLEVLAIDSVVESIEFSFLGLNVHDSQLNSTRGRNFLMAANQAWIATIDDRPVSVSVSSLGGGKIAIIGISASSGIGSIFEATDLGVECHLGVRGDGLQEALAKSLLRITGCPRVILALAFPNLSSQSVQSLVHDLKNHIKVV